MYTYIYIYIYKCTSPGCLADRDSGQSLAIQSLRRPNGVRSPWMHPHAPAPRWLRVLGF